MLPPAEAMVRTQPVQQEHLSSTKKRRVKKPSKMYQAVSIVYPEDRLRHQFFTDHPWELARPRIVLEDDGKDTHHTDWSRLGQPGRATDGESVIQRQMWLMQNDQHMTEEEAYDQARREFYQVRYEQDVERRVAKEEALAVGAYFGKSYMQVGMELEDKMYEDFKAWAFEQGRIQDQMRQASYSDIGEDVGEDDGDSQSTDDGASDMGEGASAAAKTQEYPQRGLLGSSGSARSPP
ncbi:MAG: mitochondrial ribosomal small subunit component [Lichina confinis]|nr:MAG: mitochondrial ribosomal small subunit component [Lichina confinis]